MFLQQIIQLMNIPGYLIRLITCTFNLVLKNYSILLSLMQMSILSFSVVMIGLSIHSDFKPIGMRNFSMNDLISGYIPPFLNFRISAIAQLVVGSSELYLSKIFMV